jgi:hypothetical protein
MKGKKPIKTITNITYPAFALFALACFGLSPAAQAVVPPPDGGYANRNTAEGQDALFSLTTGEDNTALGFQALYNGTTTGGNTAVGSGALFSNTDGSDNTAVGYQALYSNTSGGGDNAFGFGALSSNISGIRNLAVGSGALGSLTSGDSNVAVGNIALFQGVTVNFNTALGRRALFRSQGDQNVGLGFFAGGNLNDGGNNIYLGNVGPVPIGSESNTIRLGTQTATTVTTADGTHAIPAHTATYIAGIYSTPVAKGLVVKVDSTGHLGTVGSSGRFKEQIKPMGNASEAILGLKPVTFRYKKEIDPERTPEFGLVAEDVAKVNPALVLPDKEGKPYTVSYDAVNAMLLNEFLKEHRKVETLEATVANLVTTVKEQSAQIQKVSAQLEVSKAAPQVAENNE